MSYVWMQITHDEFELPVAVANTAQELADIVGTTKNNVQSATAHVRRGRNKWSRFIRVQVDDDEE